MHGMPPHIAQLVAGHRDINTTMGYKAVYPEEAINGHRAFIARRRALRPSEEYRTPTDDEWDEFPGHFVLCTCQVAREPRCWMSAWVCVPPAGRMAGMPRSTGAMRASGGSPRVSAQEVEGEVDALDLAEPPLGFGAGRGG